MKAWSGFCLRCPPTAAGGTDTTSSVTHVKRRKSRGSSAAWHWKPELPVISENRGATSFPDGDNNNVEVQKNLGSQTKGSRKRESMAKSRSSCTSSNNSHHRVEEVMQMVLIPAFSPTPFLF